MSHCTVVVLMWNSSMSSGNSTFINVSVRMPMNAMPPVARMESNRFFETCSEDWSIVGTAVPGRSFPGLE